MPSRPIAPWVSNSKYRSNRLPGSAQLLPGRERNAFASAETFLRRVVRGPTGVIGDGNPSGGANTAEGEITYNSSSNNGWWVETCTLPASMAKICVATISIFNINYGTD